MYFNFVLSYVKVGLVVLEKKKFMMIMKKIDSWKIFNIFKINFFLRGRDGVLIRYIF